MPEHEDDLPSSRLKEIFESLMTRYRYYTLAFLLGVLIIGIGILFFKKIFSQDNGSVEILNATSSGEVKGSTTDNALSLVVEVSGEVEKPGVYEFSSGARIADALEKAGGLTDDADTIWIAKTLNRAAKLVDGQKLYIPSQTSSPTKSDLPSENHSESLTAKELTTPAPTGDSRTINSSSSNGLVNINNASLAELDKLPGIGQVYGQKIIEHRPYSDINELVSKGALKKSTFDKLKDKISVY